MSKKLITLDDSVIQMIKVERMYKPLLVEKGLEIYNQNKRINSKIKTGVLLDKRV